MMAAGSERLRPPKETARVPSQEPKAADLTKHQDSTADADQTASHSSGRLANLVRRFADFNHCLFPLPDGQLLLSSAGSGGMSRILPDLRSASILLKLWEGR